MKNLYSLLNLPAGADSQQVSKAVLRAAEQELLSLQQLREIRDTLSTPIAKAEYDVKLFQTHPDLRETLVYPPVDTEPAEEETVSSDNHNDYLIFVDEHPLSPSEKQRKRMRTVHKSTYIISGFFGGIFGLHHLLVGNRASATVHLILSLTLIGLPVMFFKSLIDIYQASAQVPDENGMINL